MSPLTVLITNGLIVRSLICLYYLPKNMLAAVTVLKC